MTGDPLAVLPIDGRRARRERGRIAVIDAVFELLGEGIVPPPVDEVAARAGVSVSTVFRYFEGLDDMQREALSRFRQRFDPLFEIPRAGQGPLHLRIDRLVDARLSLYAAAGPILAVAGLRALEHAELRDAVEEIRSTLAQQVRSQFAPELAQLTTARAGGLSSALDSVASPEAWELLTQGYGRSRRQVREAWVIGLDALVSAWLRRPVPARSQEGTP